MTTNAIFMIESGRPLEMIKEHIVDRQRVWDEARALARELGADEIWTDRRTGVLTGVRFAGKLPDNFTKPKKRDGASFPKRGTAAAKRFIDLVGYRDPSEWIATEFGIPLSIGYAGPDFSGWTCIGSPLAECGFLFLGADGPYAMWVPNVPAHVAAKVADGYTVKEPAASFKFDIDGARRIEQEEWDILVLQRDLAKKQAASKEA